MVGVGAVVDHANAETRRELGLVGLLRSTELPPYTRYVTTRRACSSKTGGVGDWQVEFLVSCLDVVDDVTLTEGAFSPGPALWVGSREIAHFDQDTALDVRLTKSSIRSHRQALKDDPRITLRKHQSDWIALSIEPDSDVKWAHALVVAAVEANRATAPNGPPPEGAELARRRRLH